MSRLGSAIVTAALAGVMSIGVVASAQGPGPGGPDRGGRRAGTGLPLGALSLSDTQREQIRDVREQHRGAARQAQERLRQVLEAQRKAVESIPPDEGAIRALTQELADAHADVAVLQARLQADIWALLTPEQQEQARKIQADRETRMQERRPRAERRRPRRG